MRVIKNIFVTIFFSIITFSCNDKYENEEFKAIQDISNDYLYENDLVKVLNPPQFEDVIEKPDVEKLDLKVYISKELRPIAQIKEDNLWMFKNNNISKKDSIIFYGLVNSEKFKSLEYRTFDKSKITFIKPYNHFNYNIQKLKVDENYNSISFSRFCFNKDFTYGITVIDYHIGSTGYNFAGYNMSLLIKKIKGKWRIVKSKSTVNQ